DGKGSLRSGALGCGQDRDQANLSAERRRTGASRPGVPQDRGLDGAHGVNEATPGTERHPWYPSSWTTSDSAWPRESDWMEFLETTAGRYATPALFTARPGRRAHRIPPGRSPSPPGVRARESEMRARTECGCHRRRAAVASP